MKVKKGSLVAIVGKVGSGKSSLMAGLLNQMHKLIQIFKSFMFKLQSRGRHVDTKIKHNPPSTLKSEYFLKCRKIFKYSNIQDLQSSLVEVERSQFHTNLQDFLLLK